MERGKLFLMVLVFVIVGLSFNSCSKDDEVKNKSLAGTIWEGEFSIVGEAFNLKMTFNKDRCVFVISTDNILSPEEKILLYSYNHPEISFTEEGKYEIYSKGEIRGDYLFLISPDSIEPYATLQRKK